MSTCVVREELIRGRLLPLAVGQATNEARKEWKERAPDLAKYRRRRILPSTVTI